MFDVTIPATEIEIAEAVSLCNAIDCNNPVADVIRKLAFERDRLRDGLKTIANHSVCCDARHCADRVLAGKSPDIE
jgi:hypothetical protein